MSKKKESTKIKAIILTAIITVVVVLAIIVVLSLWYTSTDKAIEKILDIEEDYIRNADVFSVEYSIATLEQVTSLASLDRARKGIENSKHPLANMEETATQIKEIIAESKPDYSGDKLLWFEKVEVCYDKRLTMIENYNKVLSNEEKYLAHYESISKFDSTYNEFSQLLTTYLVYAETNDKVNAKKTLNEMKVKTGLMRNQLQNANSAITFFYLDDLIDWTNKYDELIDLSLQYFDSTGSEQTKLDKQILDKGVEAGKILNDATNKLDSEFDEWYIANISDLRDLADKDFLYANQACEGAGDLYEEIFP